MPAPKLPRIVVAALSLSAAGFGALVMREDYTPVAVIPTKGDVPTVGFGSTVREDGAPVRMGDTITPPAAITRSLSHIGKDETRLKQCITAPLNQAEYDLLVDFAYQYGVATACNSSVVRHVNAGRYAEACEAYTLYRNMTSSRDLGPGWVVSQRNAAGQPVQWRFDCSTPGNKVCGGVWSRSLGRRNKCMEAQP